MAKKIIKSGNLPAILAENPQKAVSKSNFGPIGGIESAPEFYALKGKILEALPEGEFKKQVQEQESLIEFLKLKPAIVAALGVE